MPQGSGFQSGLFCGTWNPLPLPGFPFTAENIKANRAVRYECDEEGTQLNSECLSEIHTDGDIGDERKEDIEEYYDMQSRKTDI